LLYSSRARGGASRGNSNGVSRYSSATSGGNVGPMRHNASAWVRNDTRPYDSIPVDHGAYDRARPYDVRSDSRRYYETRQDTGYGTEYEAPGYTSSSGGGQVGTRHYRDLPPHTRADGYAASRPYDHHLSAPTVDPYYGSGLPQGPPPTVDAYQSYDPYQKYYASRPRDPEFPGQHEYDLYTNYRNDPYGIANGQGSLRHDLSASLQQSQGVYPPSHRQQQPYASGSPNLAQYYGAQQR